MSVNKENQNTLVILHKDLDGVASYIAFCWAIQRKLEYVATIPTKLEVEVDKILSKYGHGRKLVFLDMDVSGIGDKIDRENVLIIDHHKTNIYPFKKAKTLIYNEGSCAKIIYDSFIKKHIPITDAQKTLILLANDWDSGKREISLSEELNIVYHGMSNKVESFIEDYYDGFKPFDEFKINTITLYKKHRKEFLATLKPFVGKVKFEGQLLTVGSVMCDKFVEDSCNYLFTEHKVDIAIGIMVQQNRIAVRRAKHVDSVDVSAFVQRVANGGGHEAAAGGAITEEFIEFTKMLKSLD